MSTDDGGRACSNCPGAKRETTPQFVGTRCGRTDNYARQQLSGLETWFTLPGQQALIPPPRWKMAFVTVLGVWPVSMLVPWLLNPLISNLPLTLQALCMAVGIVICLTWAVMPILANVLGPWLQDRPSRKKEKTK